MDEIKRGRDDLREAGETEADGGYSFIRPPGGQDFDHFLPFWKYMELFQTLPVKCLDAYFWLNRFFFHFRKNTSSVKKV